MKKMLSEYTKNRNNNFNLIRFIAASLVLYTHSFALSIGTEDAEPLRGFLGMTLGSIAVDIFFITSGFLIASSFFVRNNILAFVWARLLRIYPALIVAIIFCTFGVGLFFTTNTALEYLSNYDTYKYFFKNITLFFGVEYRLPGVFADTPYKGAINGSIWTLPYEIKMYICLTIIAYIVIYIKKWIKPNLIKIIFLSIALAAITLNLSNHFQIFCPIKPKAIHLFSMFFMGVAFYVCRENIYISSRVFILLIIFIVPSVFFKEIFFIVYCISLPYMVFYLAYVPSGSIRKFNEIGDYSYGIYIYAFPVQQSIAALIPGVSVLTMILLSFFITFILAFLSWIFIEKQALKKKGSYVIFEKMLEKHT